jgi:quaternary ammonium compound-resistance protein SugE
MAWIVLLLAGLLEIVWAVGLKYSDGFTRLWPSIGTALALLGSLGLLGLALRSLPLGTVYAIWTGIGAVGTTVAGIYLFREPLALGRLLCLGLIVTGILGLKVLGATE